jgi:hypothetical protein
MANRGPRPILLAAPVLLTALVGCSALLPKSQTHISDYQSFEQARSAIESLVLQQSNLADLKTIGIDPLKSPNTTLLTHADVVRRFVPSGVIERKDLHPGIVQCLEARDTCRGVDVTASHVGTERQGGFFADFFNFVRRTEVRGWKFNAVVLLVDDVVVYRSWGGQPHIEETDVRRNPLGPLQDIGPSTISVPAPVVVR